MPVLSFSTPVFAYNINDLADVRAIASAAEEANRPVIFNVSAKAIRYAGLPFLVALHSAAKKSYSVPLYLQLDHATEISVIRECLEAGFDFIMADGSSLSFDDNVRFTRQVVEEAHRVGVLVEGEIGHVGFHADDSPLTDRDTAVEFYRATQVDLLAVSVGNIHGFSSTKPDLDIPLIRCLTDVIPVPLVLHGADFLTSTQLEAAIQAGIRKINIGPEIRVDYANACRKSPEILSADTEPDHRKILATAEQMMKQSILRRLTWLRQVAV